MSLVGFWSDLQKAERALLKLERCPAHPRYRMKRPPRACAVCRFLWERAEEKRRGPAFGGISREEFLR